MKLENNWRNKTIENLEKDKWPAVDLDSYLVKRTQELRKIPINAFTADDLRIMIGQQIGLNYLIQLLSKSCLKICGPRPIYTKEIF